jgi:hypothetical protein
MLWGYNGGYIMAILETSYLHAITHITLYIDLATVSFPLKNDWNDKESMDVHNCFPLLTQVNAIFRACPHDMGEETLHTCIGFLEACNNKKILNVTQEYWD